MQVIAFPIQFTDLFLQQYGESAADSCYTCRITAVFFVDDIALLSGIQFSL